MKDKLKNALTHDIELFGKTVSTVAIAALFLIGAGSAAVLTQYGQVDGTAEVDQAVTISQESFSTDVAGGEVDVEEVVLTNNANVSIPVKFVPEVTNQPDSSGDSAATEGTAVTTSYVTVDELVSVDNSEDLSSPTTQGDMKSELVYDEEAGEVAVRAYGQTIYKSDAEPSDSTSYAGATFDVGDTTYTGSNGLTIDYRVGEEHRSDQAGSGTTPDWVTYQVSYEGETYYLLTFTADISSGSTFNMDSSSVQAIVESEGNVVYQPGAPDNELTQSELVDEATVEKVTVSTGSGADDETYVDMYYHDVKFAGGSDLLDTSSTAEVTPGEDRVGIVTDFAIDAYPGSYTVQTTVEPVTAE